MKHERSLFNPPRGKLLIGLILGLASNLVVADQSYLVVGFECSPSKSELAVWFRGYENENGEYAISNLGPNNFNPRALVTFSKKNEKEYLIQTKTIVRRCSLGSEKYQIEISPLMSKEFKPEGYCASRIGAKVVVKLRKKVLVTEGFDACTESGDVTSDFVISPHREPTYKKIFANDFFNKR